MTRMDCGEVRDLLQSYADDELPGDERVAVDQHLKRCSECSTNLAELHALRQRIRSAGTFTLPSGFEQRVRDAIGVDQQRQAPLWRRFAALAASHVFALLLGGLIAYTLSARGDANHRISREIVTAHVRSLLTDQLVQVATSDTHTVKPWFMGKIPFSPDVVDLSARDFPLIGGRLEFVLDRPAAALVYGRRQHRINVFMIPADQAIGSSAFNDSRNGYSVIAWHQGNFAYFAASDLNVGELQDFVSELRKRVRGARPLQPTGTSTR